MKRIALLITIFVIALSAIAQTDYYYYYHGNKIPLTLNENKVCINIPKDCGEISARIHENVPIWGTINDEDFDIFVVSRSDFEQLISLDFWKEDAKSVILTYSYYTENNVEVWGTPYLTVKLNKEEDKDILTSCAEQYKLKIVRNSPLMPLWYTLAVTKDCIKNTLECANELYESGQFAESVPDFVSDDALDLTDIHDIFTTTSERLSKIYDLQGRRLNGKPAKGLYIQGGKKYVK